MGGHRPLIGGRRERGAPKPPGFAPKGGLDTGVGPQILCPPGGERGRLLGGEQGPNKKGGRGEKVGPRPFGKTQAGGSTTTGVRQKMKSTRGYYLKHQNTKRRGPG